MHVIHALNVNDAYRQGITTLAYSGDTRQSRNGEVLVMDEPVTTHYRHPTQRVLFDPVRDANPFFHVLEALWMLAGRNDLAPITYLVRRFSEYSDDGQTLYGAYGHRWRHHFGFDQLAMIVEELHTKPDNRRVMLQMWSAADDLGHGGKDVPCNTMAKFWLNAAHDRLNMAVFCRSNDIIYGCYGANAVHFSMLQEYIASRLGVQCGYYEQISCDYHAYTDIFTPIWAKSSDNAGALDNPYTQIGEHHVNTVPLMLDPMSWDYECRLLVDHIGDITHRKLIDLGKGIYMFKNPFFRLIAVPMLESYWYFRQRELDKALENLNASIAMDGPTDWLVAGRQWMERRQRRTDR